VRREAFRAGKATLVEVDDAATELTRARLEFIDANVSVRQAALRLAYACGRGPAR
jgi:outer membrane protein TolC